MNLKKFAVASAMALASAASFAAPGDELVSFALSCNGPLCASFTTGLAPAVPYTWEVSLTTTGKSFFTGVDVNGTSYAAAGKNFYMMGGPTSGMFDLDVFTGTSGSTASLNFGGSVTLTQAIPEPETYALMLAGLGAIGFMARRRKA